MPPIKEESNCQSELPMLSLKEALINEISQGRYGKGIELLGTNILSKSDAKEIKRFLEDTVSSQVLLSPNQMNLAFLIIRNTSKK